MNSGRTIGVLREAARAIRAGDDRDVLRAVQAAQDALDAVKAGAFDRLKRSESYELDGASTATVWARNELRLNALETKALTAAGSTMLDLPAVAEAAEGGRVRLQHVAAFGYGLKHIGREIIQESEPWLLDVATTCEPSELRRVMRTLREALYPDSLDEAWAEGMDKQDIQVNAVPQGWHVNGFLNTVTGSKLKTVLEALGAPRDKDDRRSGSERRVDALDALVSTALASRLPSDKGVHPHLSVMVDAETLHAAALQTPGFAGSPAAPAQLAGFGSIGPDLLGYLGCVADRTSILASGADLPQARILNVGRTYRLATLKQRRAVIARQGGECAAPGCRNTHLEVHHADWWSHGGRTDLDQLVGLCVRCHHLVHRKLLTVKAVAGGAFAFTDRDDRPLRQEYRRRLAYRRELGHIRRVAIDLRARREQRLVPLRT